MVHALERARKHLVSGGALVLIQPHRLKRPFIAVTSARKRQRVAGLINPAFQAFIDAANGAIRTVLEERRFVLTGTSDHQFRVRLASLAELRRYLHQAPRPSRFPSRGKQRLRHLWRHRPGDARIEVTESLTIIALRATSPGEPVQSTRPVRPRKRSLKNPANYT